MAHFGTGAASSPATLGARNPQSEIRYGCTFEPVSEDCQAEQLLAEGSLRVTAKCRKCCYYPVEYTGRTHREPGTLRPKTHCTRLLAERAPTHLRSANAFLSEKRRWCPRLDTANAFLSEKRRWCPRMTISVSVRPSTGTAALGRLPSSSGAVLHQSTTTTGDRRPPMIRSTMGG